MEKKAEWRGRVKVKSRGNTTWEGAKQPHGLFSRIENGRRGEKIGRRGCAYDVRGGKASFALGTFLKAIREGEA